ncbi:Nif3-like dinuclear metal center hexameric protein [Natronorarus salvus]|uniref:Nif3-like dinuclear metal center hexameric protein n=1 Tax=Natronorarus salvus TaxID=3117733 RepID=UPI002F260FB8
MRLTELCERLDDELRTEAFADLDASANGLQVGPREAEIDRVALAVDAAVETIEAAREADADLLLTHHGLSWGGIERITRNEYDRTAALIDGEMALYVSHLPLDSHPEIGNAAGVATVLDLDDREPFGSLDPETIGLRGRLPEAVGIGTLEAELESALDPKRGVYTLEFGPETVESVAVVTGSGVDWLDEAADAGVDAFVTGEGKGHVYHEAREAGIHVLLAGHYATETFGVRSVGELVEGWGLETTFVDRPTGL